MSMIRNDENVQAVAGHASPGSWIDQLQARLDRTSVGPWAVYGLMALLLAGGLHLAHWLSGSLAFPSLSLRLAWDRRVRTYRPGQHSLRRQRRGALPGAVPTCAPGRAE